ncbi:ABC transporter permease subunit [Halorubrum sp. JWXQ-INN 858]|uniref:ABC transporter permease n=1 Tax=Halorubrum sp. JWXQ-INN 858 TaxID=2690782 RepID=UPI00135AB154|nr:ABC transporter permease [Halorubrum sp. JWXQ-INN 858]MWV64445.1 ABC transporter permease subunit [Halorubrum sp. JWXQ-INN 858]
MRAYLAKRLLWTLVATWITVTITFLLLELSPVSASEAAFIDRQVQAGMEYEAAAELYDRQLGGGGTATERYLDFVVGLATLEWGHSTTYNRPVVDVVADAWVYSVQYVLPATVVAVVVGFAIGLYSATHQYSAGDYAATTLAFVGVSLPNFWFAVICILVGGVWLGWFPTHYTTDVPGLLSLANAHQLVLPTFVLGTAAIASQARYARAESLEYVRADFVTAARSKGISERAVAVRHVLRPASVPLATVLVGDVLGLLFAGAYVIEVIFGIPGLGLVSYRAILQGDTSLVLATTLIPVFVAILGNLCQDVAYTLLDPRIELGEGR